MSLFLKGGFGEKLNVHNFPLALKVKDTGVFSFAVEYQASFPWE